VSPGRRRLLTGLAAGAGAALLATRAWLDWDSHGPLARPVPPLRLPPGSRLESLGGLLLNRGRIGFGGLSSLRIDDDLLLTAVSDTGFWLQARLQLDDRLRPQGLAELQTGPLSTGLIIPLPGRFDQDAESLEHGPDGRWLVGFERWQRIRSYAALSGAGAPVETPPGLADSPLNAGLESLAILADGRWLAISEGLHDGIPAGHRRAWLGAPGRGWMALSYAPAPGFNPTDASALPDGSALILERRFGLLSGFQGRLCRISAPALSMAAPGQVLRPEVVLDGLPGENWEGVSGFVRDGRQCVAILADDNEMPVQQGLLLLFAWHAFP
jgi:hypothetical protein